MERKLVKQGKSALTMSLPSEWTKKFGLTEKDSVIVSNERDALLVSAKKHIKNREIKVDIRDMQKGLAFHILTGKYIEGYDKFIIKHDNQKLANEIANGFIGFIAEELTEDTIVMRDIINVPEDNFLEIFKRSCQILISQVRKLKEVMKDKEVGYKEVKIQERLLDNNLFYCLRYINKYEKIENSYKYFLLSTTLESVGDLISEIAKTIDSKKIKKSEIENINHLIKAIEKYVVNLFQDNINNMYSDLRKFAGSINKDSFIGGLTFSISEALYNYIGFLIKSKQKIDF